MIRYRKILDLYEEWD